MSSSISLSSVPTGTQTGTQTSRPSSTASSVPDSTTSTNAPSETPSEEEPVDDSAKPCTPGLSVGYMLIRTPNITSVLYTGIKYNVSWDYTRDVTNPPQYVDAAIQFLALRTTWKNVIGRNISTSARHFFWEPKGLVEGKYRLRLTPTGKETFDVPADKRPCFGDGESLPSQSAEFKIFSPKTGGIEYDEKFPASSGAMMAQDMMAQALFWNLFLALTLILAFVRHA